MRQKKDKKELDREKTHIYVAKSDRIRYRKNVTTVKKNCKNKEKR